MEKNLLLQKGNKLFMLISYVDRFHILTVNQKLDEIAEEKILAGNCSEAVMDEMGLTRITVLKKALRGVAYSSCVAGSALILYTKEEKLKYVFSDDYTDEDMNAFFSGIPRFQAPKDKRSGKQDWRAEKQTQKMWKIMLPLGIVLDVLGVVCFVGSWLQTGPSLGWTLAGIVLIAVSVGVYFAFEPYFSIMGKKEYHRMGYRAKVCPLEYAILGPCLGLGWRALEDYNCLDWGRMLAVSLILGIIFSVMMYRFSRECRENTTLTVLVVLFSAFLAYGLAGQVNHHANLNPEAPQLCRVTEMEFRNGETYYCTVKLESGEELEFSVSRAVYERMQPGDSLLVFCGEGALGITYAYYFGQQPLETA